MVSLLSQVMVPPLAKDAAGSGIDPPPVLPLQPDSVTVDEMFPESPLHLIPVKLAQAGLAVAPMTPTIDIEVAATARPMRLIRE